MKFSIITPTFRRHEKLIRAVESLRAQTYKDWEMIIVNDSPSDETYKEFASSINDPRIHYYVNQHNKGVNYTRNNALDKLSADSKWVIFLDDDDYLAPDTLSEFAYLIQYNQSTKWFLTNRTYTNGKPITQVSPGVTYFSYITDYLLFKKIKGDATHCIETKLITQEQVRFSHFVKQGEEWFFFYQLGLLTKIFYHDHNSTITDGYDAHSGLNFRKRTRAEQFETISTLLFEGVHKRLVFHISFISYIVLRYEKVLFSFK